MKTTFLFSQENPSQKEILKMAEENYASLKVDFEKAFHTADKIQKEAQKMDAKEAELKAILTKCEYYSRNINFEKMMVEAKLLNKKADEYDVPLYEVIAKRFLFESYLFTGLPENAFQVLEQGKELMYKLDDNKVSNISERANYLVAYSNYYLVKEDYKNQLYYIKLAGKELEKLDKGNLRQKLLSVHYSNLATSYNENSLKDSAQYFALLSQNLAGKDVSNDVRFNNLIVLGDVGMSKSNYREAIASFNKAEKVVGFRNHVDVEELYNNLINAYRNTGNENLVKIYQTKKDSLRLSISENRNKSLHRLLNEKDDATSNSVMYVFVFLFSAIPVLIFFVFRNKKLNSNDQFAFRSNSDSLPEFPSDDEYSKLLKAIKENDTAFMFYFGHVFPEFSSKLSQINPEISPSDIEFCALLKLKISTKEIAKFKFVEPKTVRNRKYLIRKKLNIPKEIGIYQWFDAI